MKIKNSICGLTLIIAMTCFLMSCEKDVPEEKGTEPEKQEQEEEKEKEQQEEIQPGIKLVSATKESQVSAMSLVKKLATGNSTFEELINLNLLSEDLISFDIITYYITYNSTVHRNGKNEDMVLDGTVSFVVDTTGKLGKRRLETVTLYNTIYNTSYEDVNLLGQGTGVETLLDIKLRAVYNALVVYPYYQGGPVSKDKIYASPSEFLMKGKQAIDCELAALELVEKLENVEMKSGYYTENVGVSNGGGPALAIAYLIENDTEYKQYSDKINLRSTLVGEGNCDNRGLMENILKEYDGSKSKGGIIGAILDTLAGGSIDVTKLAPVGYLTTVSGTYKTWEKEYFEDKLKLEQFYKDSFLDFKMDNPYFPYMDKKNPLDVYLNNIGSLMIATFSCELPDLSNTVSEALTNEDGHSFKDCEEIQTLYNAFKENECMLSGWTPSTLIKFAHSKADDFLLYDVNYQIYQNLSKSGTNPLVRMETMSDFNHVQASMYILFVDTILKKHPF